MTCFESAPAKVNLTLHVTGRRSDGYHLLDSLVVFAGIGDRLSWEPDCDFSLVLGGPFAAGLEAEPDNLVLRAGRTLAAAGGIAPYGRVTLDKHLPLASGIGGGSADAAAALRLLARAWGVSLAPDALHRLALALGADVPVCLAGRARRMSGVGEVLTEVPLPPPCGLVLVNPGVALTTPAVFRARTGPFSVPIAPAAATDARSFARDVATGVNDLEAPAIALCPAIADVLAALRAHPDCLLARMSGSGATCFALCADPATARGLAATMARPGWWAWGGGFAGDPT